MHVQVSLTDLGCPGPAKASWRPFQCPDSWHVYKRLIPLRRGNSFFPFPIPFLTPQRTRSLQQCVRALDKLLTVSNNLLHTQAHFCAQLAPTHCPGILPCPSSARFVPYITVQHSTFTDSEHTIIHDQVNFDLSSARA